MNILTYNGQVINQRFEDGYINATQMCSIHGKKINDWTRNNETQEYIDGISTVTGIPATELIRKVKPDVNKGISGSTWIHPKLAICLGRWISVPFAIWCDEHIRTLIETGSTSLTDHRLDPEWQKLRKQGKVERLNLTDEVKSYVERHPELSPKERKYIYAAHSDALNRGLYGRSAKQLRECLGLKNGLLRDCFLHDEIAACQSVEEIAAWWIRSKDMNPVKAINKVIELIEYSRRFAGRHHEPLPAIAPKPKGKKPKALAAPSADFLPHEGQMNFFDLL